MMDTLKMNNCDTNNMDSGHAVQGSEETKSTEIEQELCKSSEMKNCSTNGTEANASDKDEQKSNQKDEEVKENNNVRKKQFTILDSDSENESISTYKSKSTEKLEHNNLNKETEMNTDKTLKDEDKQEDDELKENNNTRKKRLTILDSDSEDESIFTFKSKSTEKLEHNNVNKETETNINETLEDKDKQDDKLKENNNIRKKRLTILDSDSEDECIFTFKSKSTEKLEHNNLNKETETNSFNKTLEGKDKQQNIEKDDGSKENNSIHRKLLTIVDSDSEDENMFICKSGSKKGTEDEMCNSDETNKLMKRSSNKKNRRNNFDSDSNDASSIINNDNKGTISSEQQMTSDIQSRLQSLIDSDSETEDDEKRVSPTKNKKRTKKQDENKSNSKMRKVSVRASKEEAMKQIHSETQRLVREMEVSLPYHRPKQRSLQEFLNRKKVITALPKAPTMAAKLKMSSAIVDEVLKEKEKEAEIFYKSSDSEEEIIEDHSSDKENLDELSTQELKNNVSRKLFTDNSNKEENTVNENQEVLVEAKESEDIEVIENSETRNANDSLIVEVHCDSEDTENTNEVSEVIKSVSENDKVNDASLSKDVIEISENEKKDSEENNKKSPMTSATKVRNDYANFIKDCLNESETDEYNQFGLPPPKFDDELNVNEKRASLDFKSLKPKLRGAPGTMIDLSDETEPNKNGINALISRFMFKHSRANRSVNNMHNVTTTRIMESPNGILIIKEALPYKSSAATNEDPKLQKPGAKLVRLKEELKHKMALKRDEEWKQREQEMKEQEIEWDDSIIEEDHLSDPGSPTDESETSDEDEELEEDDVRTTKKKQKRSAYIDDEADVSDDYINDSDDAGDELSEDEEKTDYHSEEEDQDILSNLCDNSEKNVKCKMFNRIVEPSDDDSRSSNTDNIEILVNPEKSSLSQIIGVDVCDMKVNEHYSDNESDIQVSQAHMENNSKCETPQIKTNCFNLVSPVTQLTALNVHIDSENESPEIKKQLPISKTDSILGCTESEALSQEVNDLWKQTLPQRNLFADENKPLDKPTQNKFNPFSSNEPNMTESQLMDLCSGTFTSQVSDPQQSTNEFFDKMSESVQASPENKSVAPSNKYRVASSDEEDSARDEINNRSKRKVKKLDLSDDESDKDSDNDSVQSSDEEDKEEDDQEKYIDYDSEENEVVVSKKNIKQYATTFLEEEAELSESDCDVSADENEDELDKLELEEGDDEDIDESQVKKHLERMHVKQILDDDQKEVRMLKELLFEDGDLYSESTRERKFKWRNIDKQEDNNDSPLLEDKDGWVDLSDDEEESKWRQLKFERDKFIAEQMKKVNNDMEEDLCTSEIFKCGMKILKKRRINESVKQDTLLESESRTDSRIPHTVAEMLNSRRLDGSSSVIHNVLRKRSFLAKGEEALARLAAVAKQKDTSLLTLNKRNFVFTHVERSTEEESSSEIKIQPKPFNVRKRR